MANAIYKDKERGTYTVQKQYKGKTIKKRGFTSLNEAKAYLAHEMYLIDHPVEANAKIDATLNDLWNVYTEYREAEIRATTLVKEKNIYTSHIEPVFGSSLLSTLIPDKIMEWKIKLSKMGYSNDFTNKIIQSFKALLRFGYSRDYIIDKKLINELDKVKIASIPKERDILTYDEIDRFLDTFDKEVPQELMYYQYFYAFSRSGMRPNEFRGLRKKDLRKNSISVNHDITSKITGKGDILQPCKNETSVRDVLMPEDIMTMLHDRTKDYGPDDFVFGKDAALRETTLRRVLDSHLNAANLAHITIYGFRHSHATHLIRNGIMIKVVSSRLGHKDIQTTLNTYQHLLKDDQESVLKLL